ncbi:MAG TPA: CBS domain-containing protein, partial [Methylovirgula sp.]|nr:CBS domain-containing protein [Methylovirgula sp.]
MADDKRESEFDGELRLRDANTPEDETSVLPATDEDGRIRTPFKDAVAEAIEGANEDELRTLAGPLHEADLASLVEALPHEMRPQLVELLGSDFDFAALTELDANVRDELMQELPRQTVAEGIGELEADDALFLLEDLDREEQAEILEALPAVDRAALERSLEYPEGSAGRLMQTTVVTAPPFWTASQMIDFLRETDADDLPESFFEVFIVDPAHRLLGNVFLDALLRAKGAEQLGDLMGDRRHVSVNDDREEVAQLFQRYNLVSVPVVDDAERLVGVITIDDIVDVIQETADEDLKALGGVSAEEELSDNVWWTTKSRFLWLFVNLWTAFLASGVLGLF